MNDKELEKLELELEELKKVSGGEMTSSWEKKLKRLILSFRDDFKLSYETAKEKILLGEDSADFEKILSWVDEVYGKKQ